MAIPKKNRAAPSAATDEMAIPKKNRAALSAATDAKTPGARAHRAVSRTVRGASL